MQWPVPPMDGWTLDAFVDLANDLLPRYLPEQRANSRVAESVNARLIRQYATDRLIDLPEKEGREARYCWRHLLQLIATRRLMAEGVGTALISPLMMAKTDAELEDMIGIGQHGRPAVRFLESLSARMPVVAPYSSLAKRSYQEHWTRIELAPGLELHVRKGLPLPRSPEHIRRVVDSALAQWPPHI